MKKINSFFDKKEEKLEEMYGMDADRDMSTEDDFQPDFQDEEVEQYRNGFSDGYNAGFSDAMNGEGVFEAGMYESKKKVVEAEKSDEEKAIESIQWLIDNDWGKNNDVEGQASQRFKALSFNDSDISNKFLDKINKFTSGLKVEDFK